MDDKNKLIESISNLFNAQGNDEEVSGSKIKIVIKKSLKWFKY